MVASRYAGAWSKVATQQPAVAIQAPTDIRHSTAENVEPDSDWSADTAAPALPDAVDGVQYMQGYAGGGPVSQVPWDHEDGGPRGNGLTVQESIEERGYWHAQDAGAYAAETFNVQAARDGAYHVDVLPDNPNPDGDSPQSLIFRQPGVGSPIDPYARLGTRRWRWRDRWIDRHMWETDQRPSVVRNGYTAPVKAPQVGGGPYTSQFTSGTIEYIEQWAVPQNRVTPRPWDQPMAVNGTGPAALGDYGLGSWGL